MVGGGGVKILWPLLYDPPNCRIQDVTTLALLVHLSGLFISFYFHALLHNTLWLVKEAVVVVVKILSQRAVKPKTINQPIFCMKSRPR